MNKKLIAAIIAGLISLLGIVLIWQRGGIFAWIFSITGALLLIEIVIRSRTTMLKRTVVTACTLTALWLLTYGSIIAIWETGEVAELRIDTGSEENQVRVWLLDVNDNIEIFYDAEPDVAEFLLNEPKVSLVRNDQTLEFLKVEISTLETAPAEKMNQIFELWNEKYGSRNLATPIYSLMFGRAKDKVALILTLTR
tara:strand:- start:548 stop:1135 length:588 start_codon:yes stop_codon:yes gene_type:complete